MQKTEIWVIWFEIPQYGAKILNYLSTYYDIKLFATFSALPINLDLNRSIEVFTDKIPHIHDCNFAIICGAFTPFLKKVKKNITRNNVPYVNLADNNHLEGRLKKIIKKLITACNRDMPLMVPGESGKILASELGYRNVEIGMYGCVKKKSAEECERIANVNREKQIVFVGQVNERKNIIRAANVFLDVAPIDWKLKIIGTGPAIGDLPVSPRIEVEGFVQSDEVIRLLTNSRILMLPSLKEHWGVVVLEAASCGCYLSLSNQVGALYDFKKHKGVFDFDPNSEQSMATSLLRSINSASEWDYESSLELIKTANKFTPENFHKNIKELLKL